MGTRHLTAVAKDGKYKIAQYGEWDGYPSGQGVTALAFLRTKANRDALESSLSRVKYASDVEVRRALKKLGIGEWMNGEQAARYNKVYPYFTPDHGAEILELVATSKDKVIKLHNQIGFAADSLFCEWAYVVDFDKGTFEVYSGFNRSPVPIGERFAGLARGDQYEAIRLRKIYQLDTLPSDEVFLADLEDKEEAAV